MNRVSLIKTLHMYHKLPTTRLITIGLITNKGKVSITKHNSEISNVEKLVNDIEFELFDLVQEYNHSIDELDFFIEKKDYGEKFYVRKEDR